MQRKSGVTPNSLFVSIKIPAIAAAAAVAFSVLFVVFTNRAQAAACTAPATNLGSVNTTVSIPSTGTYRVWSRIAAPDANNNSYMLEIDGTNCYTIGDSAITANTWTWVDYQNGAASSKLNLNLSAGSHTIKLIGRESSVKVDRVLFVSDQSCTPAGTGDNCLVDADTTAPSVDLTAPAASSTVSGSVNVAASASDASGVSKVEFYIDGGLKGTDTTSPYAYSWDTTTGTNGSHTVMAKAFDMAGNVSSASATVTVKNGDAQAPSVPANLKATASAYNVVDLSWAASTDNVGVTGYVIQRDNVTIAQLGKVTTYKDTTVSANTKYTYRVLATDAAGNVSQASVAASVTTPAVADTQKPTAPTNLAAETVSSSQINLTWAASTDNVGVAKYDVYRGRGSNTPTKVATVTTTSYGNTGLQANTKYTFYVVAVDAAGNASSRSTQASATTSKVANRGNITGKITGSDRKQLTNARAVIWVNGNKRIFTAKTDGTYQATNLPGKFYKVRYKAKGYERKVLGINVTSGLTVYKNVTLTKK